MSAADGLESNGCELEYAALRSEMDKRMEWRNQLIFTLITGAGIIIGVGVQAAGVQKSTAQLLLIYPPIATFIAALCTQNDIRIIQLGKYIREELEPAIGGMHWQQHRAEQTEKPVSVGPVPLLLLACGGFFIFSEGFALFAALAQSIVVRSPVAQSTISFSFVEWTLFVAAVAVYAFTFYLVWLLFRWERRR